MIDVTSATIGLTVPTGELVHQIQQKGFEVTKVQFSKSDGHFVAEGKNAHGEKLSKFGPSETVALANLLLAVTRHAHMRSAAIRHRLGAWENQFSDKIENIATAYAKADHWDTDAAAAYKALADDSIHRAEVLKRQLHIEIVDNPHPYETLDDMIKDIHDNRHFEVTRANPEHPIWSVDQMIAFRIVHSIMGHVVSGGGWDWQGENLATAAHMPMLKPIAQLALFTESIAKTAYQTYYPTQLAEKVVVFPEFMEVAQGEHNDFGHRGVHPSQVLAPQPIPGIPKIARLGWIIRKLAEHGFKEVPAEEYMQSFQKVLDHPLYGKHVEPYTVEQVRQPNIRPFLGHGGTVGGLLKDHGDGRVEVSGGFNIGGPRGGVQGLLKHLTDNGANYLTAIGEPLRDKYEQAGFKTKEVYKWDDNHAPQGWDYDTHGRPDVYEMHRFANLVERLSFTPKVNPTLRDPNFNWESGVEPNHSTTNGLGNAYLEHGDPLNIAHAQENAGLIERRWWEFKKGDGTPDFDRMKQAVANALRVAILSPQKELRHNAIQYQHISHIPAHVDDPQVYWDALENRRQNWNAQKYGEEARFLHRPWHYKDNFKKLTRLIAKAYPGEDAQAHAERIVNQFITEEQERENRAEADLPEEKKRPLFDIDNAAYKAVAARVETIVKDKHVNLDHYAGTPDEPEIGMNELANAGRYGAFMGTHLKAIAKIGQNIDEVAKAALEDVQNHDGAGHHFRSAVMQLKVPFVGPKVCSFAWLLLCPNQSELATVDTHIMDMLGIKEGAMPNRDYFRAERQFKAARDASGYGHVPLGQFQWAAWDWKRTGQPQDHSPMAVDEPVPYDQVMWHPINKDSKVPKGPAWQAKLSPDWWTNTQAAQDQAGQAFDDQIGSRFPKTAIPFQGIPGKTASMWNFESKKYVPEPGEFHSSLVLPESALDRIREIAEDNNVIDDFELEDPENYHMTWLFLSDDNGHRLGLEHDHIEGNGEQSGEFKFTNARLHKFPARGDSDKDTVVVRFDSPEAKKQHAVWEKLNEDEYGIDPGDFAGDYKPHVTIGWTNADVPSKKYDLEFTSEGFEVSEGAKESKQAAELDPTKLTKIQQLRAKYPGLTTQEIWAQEQEAA